VSDFRVSFNSMFDIRGSHNPMTHNYRKMDTMLTLQQAL
jgi:hypothetical protein